MEEVWVGDDVLAVEGEVVVTWVLLAWIGRERWGEVLTVAPLEFVIHAEYLFSSACAGQLCFIVLPCPS
jgi:hypothetical protein